MYKSVEEVEDLDLFSPLYLPLMKKQAFLNKKPKVIVIAGPTAVGKSRLAIQLAQRIEGEVVSADSMQVYKGMDIGTAKILEKKREGVKHHLIDIVDLKNPFNVVDFYKEANGAISNILIRNRVPIVAGGSGFYLHVLLYGPPLGPPSNPEVRKFLNNQLEKLGPEAVYERLQTLDPEYAEQITERDSYKIIRALEIITLSQKKVSDFPKKTVVGQKYNFRCWFLYLNKEEIYQQIDRRCEKMIEEGFIEEVKRLKEEGLLENSSARLAIGYKQCLEFLEKNQTLEFFKEEFKKASKHFVKKQFTWFKKEKEFRWLNLSEMDDEERVKELILQDYEHST